MSNKGGDDDDHRRRTRKRRSSPYFDEQAVRDASRREARRESRREARRDPRERDLREQQQAGGGGKKEERHREREGRRRDRDRDREKDAVDADVGMQVDSKEDHGGGGGKEAERDASREHRRHKSRHMSVDMASMSLAGGVVGVGMGNDGREQREHRRRDRDRDRLRSRDTYRDKDRERLETRESTRERKTRERVASRERGERESKERDRLASRDRKRDWELQLPPSKMRGGLGSACRVRAAHNIGPCRCVVLCCAVLCRCAVLLCVAGRGGMPSFHINDHSDSSNPRHLPTLTDAPKASRLVAFPTLAADDGACCRACAWSRASVPALSDGGVCDSRRRIERSHASPSHPRQLHSVHANPEDPREEHVQHQRQARTSLACEAGARGSVTLTRRLVHRHCQQCKHRMSRRSAPCSSPSSTATMDCPPWETTSRTRSTRATAWGSRAWVDWVAWGWPSRLHTSRSRSSSMAAALASRRLEGVRRRRRGLTSRWVVSLLLTATRVCRFSPVVLMCG